MLYLMRNLWRYDKLLWVLSTLEGLLVVLSAATVIWIPKVLIDILIMKATGLTLGSDGVLSKLVLLIVLVLAYVALTVTKDGLNQWNYLDKIMHRMRYQVMIAEKALDSDFENIDGPEGQKRYSDAMQALNSNSAATENFVVVWSDSLANIVGIVAYSSLIILLHPLLLAAIIGQSIVNYLGGRWVNRFVQKHQRHLAEVRKKMTYIANTGGDFKAAKDLKLYHVLPWFSENYQEQLKMRMKILGKNEMHQKGLVILDGALMVVRDGLAYGLLIGQAISGTLSISEFALYVGAVAGLSAWFKGLVTNLNSFHAMALEIKPLRAYLEMADHPRRNLVDMPSEFETLPCDIDLVDVCYKYPGSDHNTIDHLNLKIRAGEKLALVGLNGAGKTTLVKLICGLYQPTQGLILYDGKPISQISRDGYFKKFSVVFQDIFTLPTSLYENIACRPKASLTHRECEEIEAIIEQVGLGPKLMSLPGGLDSRLVKSLFDDAIDLSGGEYQKLMLARALFKKAPILILDEPTAALDPISENDIYLQYCDLTRGRSALFISHRLSSTRFCDRILLLQGGR